MKHGTFQVLCDVGTEVHSGYYNNNWAIRDEAYVPATGCPEAFYVTLLVKIPGVYLPFGFQSIEEAISYVNYLESEQLIKLYSREIGTRNFVDRLKALYFDWLKTRHSVLQ